MGGISFDGGGGVSKKTRMVGGVPHAPPLWETLHRGGGGGVWAWGVPPHCMIFLKTLPPTPKNDPSS